MNKEYRFDRVQYSTTPIAGKYFETSVYFQKSDKMIVTDPCYSLSIDCTHVIKNIKHGIYDGFVEIVDEGQLWGTRVASLAVLHNEFRNEPFENLWTKVEEADIGVDSGQAGFFDLEIYNTFFTDDEFNEVGEKFYDQCGEKTIGKWYETTEGMPIRQASVVGSLWFGYLSRSGYGDGGYDLYTIEKDGQTIGAKIVFIDKEVE